jgi:hypothetical protein
MASYTLSNSMHPGVVSALSKLIFIKGVRNADCRQQLLCCIGHCKKLALAWSELGKTFENDQDVVIAHIDCTKSSEVCTKAKVSCKAGDLVCVRLALINSLALCRSLGIPRSNSSSMERSRRAIKVSTAGDASCCCVSACAYALGSALGTRAARCLLPSTLSGKFNNLYCRWT